MEKTKAWENVGYITLALLVFGNITVGWFYLLAQVVFLIANGLCVIRDFALNRPVADKTKNITFFGITIALIAIRVLQS